MKEKELKELKLTKNIIIPFPNFQQNTIISPTQMNDNFEEIEHAYNTLIDNHNGALEKINKVLSDLTSSDNEAIVNEQERVQAEETRVQNEEQRISDEDERKAEEKKRIAMYNTHLNDELRREQKHIEMVNTFDTKVSEVNTFVGTKKQEVEEFVDLKTNQVNSFITTKTTEVNAFVTAKGQEVQNAINAIPPKSELIGAKGDKGDKGEKGEKGDRGERGLQGIQGERGLQGVKGDTPSITHLETSINNKINEVETRFNTLTSSQQQDAEVIDARVGENGKIYTSLGDRLNEVDSQLEQNALEMNRNFDSLSSNIKKFNDDFELSTGNILIGDKNYNITSLDIFNKNNYSLTGNIDSVINCIDNNLDTFNQIKWKSNLIFKNITFTNFKGMKFYSCNNITFENCKFIDFTHSGLFFQDCSNLKIKNCEFKNIGMNGSNINSFGHAIYIQGGVSVPSSNVIIEDCYFEQCKGNGAVYLYKTVNNYRIQRNRFINNAYGAILHWSFENNTESIISDNYIYGCGLGDLMTADTNGVTSGVGCSAIYMNGNGTNTIVTRNTILQSVENAIEGNYKEVTYNTIDGTGVNPVRATPSVEGMWIKDNSLVSFNNIKNTLGRGINVYLGSNIANNLCIQNNIINKTTNAHSIYVNVGGIDTININGNQCDKSFYLYSEKSNVGNVNICNNKFYDMYIDKKLKCANIKLTNTIISNSVDFSPLTSSWTKTSCTSLSDGVQINSWGKILQELKLNKKVKNILIDYEIEYSSVNPTTNSDSVRVVVTANGYSKNNNATLSGTNSDKVKINGTIHLLDILGCSSINFEVHNSSNFTGEAFASCTINSISCNIREC